MGRDTDTGSEVFNAEVDTDTGGEADIKSVSHNFSSLSGSASNICWVNIKVDTKRKYFTCFNKSIREIRLEAIRIFLKICRKILKPRDYTGVLGNTQ